MKSAVGPVAVMAVLLSGDAEAASTCSDRAIREIAAAIEVFDRKEFHGQTGDLCQIIRYEPECAEALWVQSFIGFCLRTRQYQGPDVLREAEMRRRALALNPTLGETWQQTGSEDRAGAKMEMFDRFEIRYYSVDDRSLVWEANQQLQEIYNELGSTFSYFPDERFPVVLYTDDTVVKNWRNVSLGGFFSLSDGMIRLRLKTRPSGELSLRTLARREFTKAYLNRFGVPSIPGWMREGAAEFYSHRDTTSSLWKENRLQKIQKEFARWGRVNVAKTVDLKEMEKLYLNKRIVTTVGKYKAYLQAEAMVLMIAKDRGDSWIPNVLGRVRAGTPWTAAYNEVVGVPPEEILRRFHRSWEWSGDR